MSNKITPKQIVNSMYNNDLFSKWLGITIVHVSKGKCILTMIVQKNMLNGFSIAHGGITYSLADSCLAFAANSNGIKCVSVETSITHLKKVQENDLLTAASSEKNVSDNNAQYEVIITNQNDDKVAIFKGTVHRINKYWE